MAILYVNSITGADGNNGSTWALAKATLASAMTAATAGDTIMCHGRFVGTVPVTKQVFWVGFGRCVFDGNAGGSFTPAAGTGFTGIEFTNFPNECFHSPSGNIIRNCSFYSLGVAINNTGICNVDNCQFYSCTGLISGTVYGAVFSNANAGGLNMRNCSFLSNSGPDVYAIVSANVYNCCLGSPIMIKTTGALFVGDWNCFDFTNGKCVVNGVDKTTLATWQAAMTAPTDANSIDRVWRTAVGDYANNVLYPNPASFLLTAGPGATPIGIQRPALTVSNNTNQALWTGGVFSGTEVDGSGYLVLSAGQTVGTWSSDVIDFGANLDLYSVRIGGVNEDATHYIDTDTADSPGFYNIEVRGSSTSFAKTNGTLTWVTVPRGAEVGQFLSPNAFRYWQIRLTLRGVS